MRKIEEFDTLIRSIPQELRRYCKNKVCGCVGCSNQQLRDLGVSAEEFNAWSQKYPDDTAEAWEKSEYRKQKAMLINKVRKANESGSSLVDIELMYRINTGLGPQEAKREVYEILN